MKLNFLDSFSKKAQISSFIKIRRVGAELIHTDGQTERSWCSLFAVLRTLLKVNIPTSTCLCQVTFRNLGYCTGLQEIW